MESDRLLCDLMDYGNKNWNIGPKAMNSSLASEALIRQWTMPL